MNDLDDYPCIGVCIDDPDTGYCLGCGRPPHETGRTPPPPPAGTGPGAAGANGLDHDSGRSRRVDKR